MDNSATSYPSGSTTVLLSTTEEGGCLRGRLDLGLVTAASRVLLPPFLQLSLERVEEGKERVIEHEFLVHPRSGHAHRKVGKQLPLHPRGYDELGRRLHLRDQQQRLAKRSDLSILTNVQHNPIASHGAAIVCINHKTQIVLARTDALPDPHLKWCTHKTLLEWQNVFTPRENT